MRRPMQFALTTWQVDYLRDVAAEDDYNDLDTIVDLLRSMAKPT